MQYDIIMNVYLFITQNHTLKTYKHSDLFQSFHSSPLIKSLIFSNQCYQALTTVVYSSRLRCAAEDHPIHTYSLALKKTQ